jgi:glutamine synthetase
MFEMPPPKTITSFVSAAKLRASRSSYVANDRTATDLPCTWQHFSVPPSAVDADAMSDGIGFDGSSIPGFQEIQESDMLVVPDPTHVHQLIEQRLSLFLVYARYGRDDF